MPELSVLEEQIVRTGKATNVDNAYAIFAEKMKDPTIERKVITTLNSLVTSIYTSSVNNSDGYCQKFNLPITGVMSFFKILDMNPVAVEELFRKDWGYPPNTKMYSDTYYHILLLMVMHGVKTGKKQLSINALTLILVKIWNGRKSIFIPYCDVGTMNYVISTMLSNKYYAAKYSTPLALITQLFVPTLLSKYSPIIAKSSVGLKQIFMQSYARIYQIFSQQTKINPSSGQREATGGLAALYYKAKEEGVAMRNTRIMTDKDDSGHSEPGASASFDQYGNSNVNDEVISATVDSIVLNKNTVYPAQFVAQVNKVTRVSAKVLDTIFRDIHQNKYYDDIAKILELILSKVSLKSKDEVCSQQFMLDLKKRVISSKNNKDANLLNKLLDDFLAKIFKDLGYDYQKYSGVQRIQIRTALIHCLIYNVKKVLCRQQLTQMLQSFKIFSS